MSNPTAIVVIWWHVLIATYHLLTCFTISELCRVDKNCLDLCLLYQLLFNYSFAASQFGKCLSNGSEMLEYLQIAFHTRGAEFCSLISFEYYHYSKFGEYMNTCVFLLVNGSICVCVAELHSVNFLRFLALSQ